MLPIQPKQFEPYWHLFHFHIDSAQLYGSPETIPLFSRPNNGNFFNCYLAAPRPTLGYSQWDSLINSMLITVFYLFQPEGHQEPCIEGGSLNPTKHLVGVWTGNLSILITNPLESINCQANINQEKSLLVCDLLLFHLI